MEIVEPCKMVDNNWNQLRIFFIVHDPKYPNLDVNRVVNWPILVDKMDCSLLHMVFNNPHLMSWLLGLSYYCPLYLYLSLQEKHSSILNDDKLKSKRCLL